MRVTRNSVDMFWKSDGDFALGENGDIRKATAQEARVLRQIIMKRLMSSYGDWPLVPNLGVGLASYAGAPNTRDTASAIKSSIMSELTRDNAVAAAGLKVRIFPTGLRELMILITAQTQHYSDTVVVQFTYDIRDNKLVPRIL